MSDLRIGIIGCGTQGSLYAAILTGTAVPGLPLVPKPEGCVLTAVSSRNAAATDNIRGMNPAICCFGDWRELLASDVCDAVVITVPHFQHHTIAIAALQAGKHVLCEKPAGVRASDAAQMADCAANHPSLTAAMMLNQRCNPAFRRVKDLLEQGELGQLRRFHWIINNWWRPDSYYRASPWRGTWKGEGGGLLVNQLPHQLDLWIWLCGEPKSVWAKCLEGAYREIEVDSDVTIVASHASGATGSLIACTHDPLGTNRLELDCSGGKVVVEEGRRVTIHRFRQDETVWNAQLSLRELMGLQMTGPEALYTTDTQELQAPFCTDYVRMFENFAAHIRGEEPLIADLEDGLAAVRLANAAQLAGWTGQELPYPCSETDYDRLLQQKMKE